MQFPPSVIAVLVTYEIRVANDGAILFYNGTPGPGTLVGAMSSQGGTDAFGNVYPAGTWWAPAGPGSPFVEVGGTQNNIRWGNTFADEAIGSSMAEFVTQTGGPGTAWGELLIRGPGDNVEGDATFLALGSSSADGTTKNATARLGWFKAIPGEVPYVLVSFDGAVITAGNIVAVHPGTGASRTNWALAETWQTPVVNVNWTTAGTNTPARFRMEPYGDGGGTVRLDGELITTGVGPWPAGQDLFNVGSGYTPATGHMFVNKSSIAVAAGQATVNVTSSGNVVNGQTFTAAGQSLYLDGMTFPIN